MLNVLRVFFLTLKASLQRMFIIQITLAFSFELQINLKKVRF